MREWLVDYGQYRAAYECSSLHPTYRKFNIWENLGNFIRAFHTTGNPGNGNNLSNYNTGNKNGTASIFLPLREFGKCHN